MAEVSATHKFSSAKSDPGDATLVRPSNWNADHNFGAGTHGDLLMRDTGATDGASWLASAAANKVLASAGAGSAPSYTDSLSVSGALHKFGSFADAHGQYMYQESLNFDGYTAGSSTGYLNYYSTLSGATPQTAQFRSLSICNGKGVNLMLFDGPNSKVTTGKPVEVGQLSVSLTATTSGVTDLLVNPDVKASGNLLSLQVGGAAKFSVDYTGAVSFSSSLTMLASQGAYIQFFAPVGTNQTIHAGVGGTSTLTSLQFKTYTNCTGTSGTTKTFMEMIPVFAPTSGNVGGVALYINPTYNQTGGGTNANTDLLINRVQTSVGSGAQYLIDAQVGGVSRFNVTNLGALAVYHDKGQATTIKHVSANVTCSGATSDATNLIPAGSLVLGVTVRVTTAVTGATTFQVGTAADADIWGTGIAIADGTTTSIANFTALVPGFWASTTSVRLTATGSNFTGGVVSVTVHYITLTGQTAD